MRRWIALSLLIAGVGLAAASGSRLGTDQAALVAARAPADTLAGAAAALEACAKPPEEGAAPPPQAEIDACRAAVRAPWEAIGVDVSAALPGAQAALSTHATPTPGPRLRQWLAAGGLGWAAGLALIVVGAVLGRRAVAAEASGEGLSTEERPQFGPTVQVVIARAERVLHDIAALPMDRDAPAARAALEAIDVELLAPLVDARGMFAARHGVSGFAEYFGPFSAGERNLARAWSALTDGHAEVARESLGAALTAFGQAAAAWDRVDGAR